MQQINIEEKEGNLLSIKAPWNPLFVEELKKLHGKWNVKGRQRKVSNICILT